VKVLQRPRQADESDMSRLCHDWDRRAIVERVQPATASPIPVDLDAAHALGVTAPGGTLHEQGETGRVFDLASVSKPLAALGVLVAVERGLIDLDEPAGPEGASVRHLLAHTAGYPFEGEETVGAVGARRIYSNTGFEVLAAHLVVATGLGFPVWMEQTVVLGLDLVDLAGDGSPAAGYRGTVRDLLAVGRELLSPTLLSADLHAEMCTVQFPGLAGILPGYGRQSPNDWGLGVEIRGHKDPHWTGAHSSSRTVGHFGQSGSFLWVDPEAQLACAFLGEERFGPAHVRIWPGITDEVLARFAGRGES
jgi:CubicO group peptidase (beta-lactamase class C family)